MGSTHSCVPLLLPSVSGVGTTDTCLGCFYTPFLDGVFTTIATIATYDATLQPSVSIVCTCSYNMMLRMLLIINTAMLLNADHCR